MDRRRRTQATDGMIMMGGRVENELRQDAIDLSMPVVDFLSNAKKTGPKLHQPPFPSKPTAAAPAAAAAPPRPTMVK